MSEKLQIEYKEFTLEMMESMKEKEKPLLEKFVVSINGVPLAECDSRTKLRAGFEIVRFLTTEMKDFSALMSSRANGAGGSSKA